MIRNNRIQCQYTNQASHYTPLFNKVQKESELW